MPMGAAPVLAHHHHVLKIEMLDEFANHHGVLSRGEPVGIIWLDRQPEPRVIHGDATKTVPPSNHDLSLQETPVGIPVEEEHRPTAALVDVVNRAD